MVCFGDHRSEMVEVVVVVVTDIMSSGVYSSAAKSFRTRP